MTPTLAYLPKRILQAGFAGAAAVALALPAAAEDSYGALMPALIDKTVRDTDTGARAGVTYVNEVMTGGMEIMVDELGVEHELMWDGIKGVFEVDFAIAGGVMPDDVPIFVRDAVKAVCPSVDAAGLDAAPVETVTGTLYRIDAQCPAADAETMR